MQRHFAPFQECSLFQSTNDNIAAVSPLILWSVCTQDRSLNESEGYYCLLNTESLSSMEAFATIGYSIWCKGRRYFLLGHVAATD